MIEEKKLNFRAEIIRCESLKKEVREKNGLQDVGLVLKKIEKNSPINVTYEQIGGLAEFIDNRLKSCDMTSFLTAARSKFCV
jgi:hypothetical protein